MAGSPFALTISGAPAFALATLVASAIPLEAVFKEGTLVPAPEILVDGLLTGSNGYVTLPTTWPAGVPAGIELFVQAWMPGDDGPQGFVATNALALEVP